MQRLLLDAGTETVGLLGSLMPFLLIGVIFYFMLIRPQKKRDKAVQEMRSALDVGDEIVTIGGIIGLVVSIKEDWLVIETGSDRSRIRIARWAVQTNNTPKEATVPVASDEAAEKPEKKGLFGRKKKDEAES